MDLNYLYYRQQVSLFMADNAANAAARAAHRELSQLYASRAAAARNQRPTADAA